MKTSTLKKYFPQTIYGQILLVFFIVLFILYLLTLIYTIIIGRNYYLNTLVNDRARYIFTVYSVINFADEHARPKLIKNRANRAFDVELLNTKPEIVVGSNPSSYSMTRNIQALINQSSLAKYDIQIYSNISSFSYKDFFFVFSKFLFATDDDGAIQDALVKDFDYSMEIVLSLQDGKWLTFKTNGLYIFIPSGIMLIFLPAVISLLFSFFFIYLAYFTVKPLKQLTAATKKFASNISDYHPLEETGPLEVRETISAFNSLQKRIFDFVNERSRLLAAISHDLRTPLTRMALRTTQLDEKLQEAFSNDINQLRQLMDTSIDLARATGNIEKIVPVDVVALLESMTDDLCELGHHVEFCQEDNCGVEILDIPPIPARPLCLKRALANLLENATRYATNVKIYIKNTDENLEIQIVDDGSGIPPEQLEKVFEPFYRLEPSRNRSTGGTGLGLAITRSMIQLCGGSVQLKNGEKCGLVATVLLNRDV